MPVLKSLSFTALAKPGNDPVQCAEPSLSPNWRSRRYPTHVRTVQRWTRVNGERQATTKQKAIRPWCKGYSSGQVVMSVKFGPSPSDLKTASPAAT
jgi:hypothetical protein